MYLPKNVIPKCIRIYTSSQMRIFTVGGRRISRRAWGRSASFPRNLRVVRFLSCPLKNPGFPRVFRISGQLLWPTVAPMLARCMAPAALHCTCGVAFRVAHPKSRRFSSRKKTEDLNVQLPRNFDFLTLNHGYLAESNGSVCHHCLAI
jgi:hypothetical protein